MARFMRRGVTKVYWCTAADITTPAAPTAAQITAGDRIDTQIAEMTGFTFAAEPIDVPDMSNTFTAKIPGGDTVENSSVTLYEDNASTTIKVALAKTNTLGYLVIFPKGTAGGTPAAADVVDVWPCTIGSNARQYTAANEAAKYLVTFTPQVAPLVDYALVA